MRVGLWLDFANTVRWHASYQPEDKPHNYADLLSWGKAADILTADRANQLRQRAKAQ